MTNFFFFSWEINLKLLFIFEALELLCGSLSWFKIYNPSFRKHYVTMYSQESKIFFAWTFESACIMKVQDDNIWKKWIWKFLILPNCIYFPIFGNYFTFIHIFNSLMVKKFYNLFGFSVEVGGCMLTNIWGTSLFRFALSGRGKTKIIYQPQCLQWLEISSSRSRLAETNDLYVPRSIIAHTRIKYPIQSAT